MTLTEIILLQANSSIFRLGIDISAILSIDDI